MDLMPGTALCKLYERIIKPGLCVVCGACVGTCPYLSYYDGKVVVMDRCIVENGRCMEVCPQHENISSPMDINPPLGISKEIIIARSKLKDLISWAQYGGVVSTILYYFLNYEKGWKCIATDRGGGKAPQGVIVEKADMIASVAGSRYSGAGSLAAFNKVLLDGTDKIAVVGLPCQMRAMDLIMASRARPLEMVKIGLFCTWALQYRRLQQLLIHKGIPLTDLRFDIPPPPANVFIVKRGDLRLEIPLDEVRGAVQSGCLYCLDMTAVTTDISVGAAEGIPGWNTVIIRTNRGSEIIKDCLKLGILESNEMPGANLEHLAFAAQNKRDRALLRIKGLGEHNADRR